MKMLPSTTRTSLLAIAGIILTTSVKVQGFMTTMPAIISAHSPAGRLLPGSICSHSCPRRHGPSYSHSYSYSYSYSSNGTIRRKESQTGRATTKLCCQFNGNNKLEGEERKGQIEEGGQKAVVDMNIEHCNECVECNDIRQEKEGRNHYYDYLGKDDTFENGTVNHDEHSDKSNHVHFGINNHSGGNGNCNRSDNANEYDNGNILVSTNNKLATRPRAITTRTTLTPTATATRREILFALSVSLSSIFGTATTAASAESSTESPASASTSTSTSTSASAAEKDDPGSKYYEYNYAYPNPSIIPYSSVRQQKIFTLKNGLKVLAVNDIRASQSTAALIVNGPGQFNDPVDLAGGAHLMEHMILSYKLNDLRGKSRNKNSNRNRNRKNNKNYDFDGDLEDWLSENGGASNAFTAYDQTCFHLNCPHNVLPLALEKFASIFVEENVVNTCRDAEILAREIRRVDSELDLTSEAARREYLTKSYIVSGEGGGQEGDDISTSSNDNRKSSSHSHPYSKFTKGSLRTLETIPREKGIDVSEELVQFFRKFYLPSQALLVVVSNQSQNQPTVSSSSSNNRLQQLLNVERLCQVFEGTLAKQSPSSLQRSVFMERYHFPGQLDHQVEYNHMIIKGSNPKMVFQWVLNQDYRTNSNGRSSSDGDEKKRDANEIAYVLNQIFSTRAPGSLYQYLREQGWIQNNSILPPQITVPINVSGFQVLKLNLPLTPDGFFNRSKVAAAVYKCVETVRNIDGTITNNDNASFLIPNDILAQYSTMAKLFGYVLSPRPPDAVELAIDSINYGAATVQEGKWYRFPSAVDDDYYFRGGGTNPSSAISSTGSLSSIQTAVKSALTTMSDPKNALIMVVSGDDKTNPITQKTGEIDNTDRRIIPFTWKREAISNAQLYSGLILSLAPKQSKLVIEGSVNEISRTVTRNPLIPTFLKPPRIIISANTVLGKQSDKNFRNNNNEKWRVLMPGKDTRLMQLPRSPPELNCRCAFVLQLLSSRPARAKAEEAAYGELWRISFEEAIADLAEQGAPGGLAYELRFNKYGMRICTEGPSQTVPTYTKKIVENLVNHKVQQLWDENKIKTLALSEASKSRDLSPLRRNIVLDSLQKANSNEVDLEGATFLQSCSGAVCFSQGDLTPDETRYLLQDIRYLLQDRIGMVNSENKRYFDPSRIPPVEDLIASAKWKPRNASPCYIPGISLMSDACGRIPR